MSKLLCTASIQRRSTSWEKSCKTPKVGGKNHPFFFAYSNLQKEKTLMLPLYTLYSRILRFYLSGACLEVPPGDLTVCHGKQPVKAHDLRMILPWPLSKLAKITAGYINIYCIIKALYSFPKFPLNLRRFITACRPNKKPLKGFQQTYKSQRVDGSHDVFALVTSHGHLSFWIWIIHIILMLVYWRAVLTMDHG